MALIEIIVQVLPQQFTQLFQDLISECRVFERNSVSDDITAATLIDRLEGTLSIVEEGVQLLQGTTLWPNTLFYMECAENCRSTFA